MINLTRGATAPETVVLTLTENAECIGPSASAWVFELTDVVTGATVVFTSPDNSSYPERYNSFQWQALTGASGEDLLDGKIYLEDLGTYDYTAYQFYESVPQDIDLANAIKIVEVGRLTLRETESPFPQFSTGATVTPNFNS